MATNTNTLCKFLAITVKITYNVHISLIKTFIVIDELIIEHVL